MSTLAEIALQVVSVIVIVFGLLCAVLVLVFSEIGLMAVFIAAFTFVIAAPSLLTLLAADFIYPDAVVSAGWIPLLWLVFPASLASVLLFDFLLDALFPRSLRERIRSDSRFGIGETIARGVFIALMLDAASRFVPEAASVSFGAALTAGMVSAFVRYCLRLYFDDTGDAGFLAEEFAEELD